MNKANKINPIDIIFVRIFIYTKVMKKIYPQQVTDLPTRLKMIVFQKVCKFQFIYFCNRTVKNNLLWNLHLSK